MGPYILVLFHGFDYSFDLLYILICLYFTSADEINSGFSSRNRLSFSFFEHDAPHSLSFGESTSHSFHRSSTSNGSMGREGLPLRAYNSFGRSHRDRNRGREKDLERCHRNRPLLEENGLFNNPDSFVTNKLEKESLWHPHSKASGGGDALFRRLGHDSSKNVPSRGSIIGGISKSSFERDFPSLAADEKHVGSDIAIHNLPVSASTIIGVDGWTSDLVEVPPIVGGKFPGVSSVSNPSSGLNMAETVAQAPAQIRASSQVILQMHFSCQTERIICLFLSSVVAATH